MSTEKDSQSRRPLFARAADGSLKPVDDTDIGDVWAQQERIRLAREIEEDKAKAERQSRGRNPFRRQRPADRSGMSTSGNVTPASPQKESVERTPKKPLRSGRDDKKARSHNDTKISTGVAESKTIEININMPSTQIFGSIRGWVVRASKDVWRATKRFKRSVGLAAVSIFALLLILVIYNLVFHRDSGSKSSSESGQSAGGSLKATPTFNTILPSDKSIQQLGGWAKVSPADSAPAYAYVDEINGIKIIVSEQQLPKSFKSDPDASVLKLAEQFAANQTIKADGTTIYHGKSTKGTQSLVFTKGELLMLIKADSSIADDQWKDYVNSLK